MKRYLMRSLATLFILAIAFLAFWLPPHPETVTRAVGDDVSVMTTEEYGHQFFEWIGIVLLALALWKWRDVLKLTGVGPLSGPLLKQQSPDEIERAAKESGKERHAARTFAEAREHMEERRFQETRSYILDYLAKHHAIDPLHLANTLRVSKLVAASLLDSLVAEGLVRQDGFPRRTLYTLASSLENKVIDYVRDKFVVPAYRLLSERRFVRVGRNLQIDAVLECEERTFLIEVRFVRSQVPSSQIEGGVRHLVRVASEFSQHTLGGYMVLVVWDPEDYDAVKRHVERITLDADNLPVIVLAVTKDEVVGTAGS